MMATEDYPTGKIGKKLKSRVGTYLFTFPPDDCEFLSVPKLTSYR